MQSNLNTDADAVEILAHCRRTAAVAKLMAHHLFLSPDERNLLDAACLLHHRDIGLLAPKSMERLLKDVLGESAPSLFVDNRIPLEVRGILHAYQIPGVGTMLESKLAGILRVADAFDQAMETQPIDAEEVGEILDRLRGGVAAGLWPEEVIDALDQSTRPAAIGQAESWRVPVSPQSALRTLNLMRDPRASIARVVETASLDPATAGLLMELANSALHGARTRVSTLAQAITRLGFATSQKVINSAALHRVFDSPRLQHVWVHSLQVADLAEQLAFRMGTIDPSEAYLAGLLHDVGQIALLSLQVYDSARLQGMLASSCPAVYAENLLLRTDHAALGALIAEGWRLPEPMVSAIRQHHRPEKAESPLGHVLYAAEYLSGAEEDLPSVVRLELSLKGIGLGWDDVGHYSVSPLGRWLAAA